GNGASSIIAGIDRALAKFAAVQMIDAHLATTGGCEPVLTRYTQPEPELQLLINQLKLQLPPQPPPRITAAPPGLPLPFRTAIGVAVAIPTIQSRQIATRSRYANAVVCRLSYQRGPARHGFASLRTKPLSGNAGRNDRAAQRRIARSAKPAG